MGIRTPGIIEQGLKPNLCLLKSFLDGQGGHTGIGRSTEITWGILLAAPWTHTHTPNQGNSQEGRARVRQQQVWTGPSDVEALGLAKPLCSLDGSAYHLPPI